MDLANRTIWQQAAGDVDRNYADLCINWGVILNGPGYSGSWPSGEPALQRDGWSSRKLTDLRRFAEEMAPGDLVVLRIGTSEVFGVGEIVGDYEWSDAFGDVDGWELQHVRRVRWLWKSDEGPVKFPTYSLKQGDTTQRLGDGPVRDWLADLEISEAKQARELAVLPSEDSADFNLEHLAEFLFDHGVSNSSIEALVAQMDELERIAKWYKRYDNPSESETITYLVVPLLRALGWTPQKMAIEWNRVDVALFDNLPRRDEHLSGVVEAKKKDNSCLSAVSQAQSYAESRPACKRLVVTDGIRFGVYLREVDQFKLHAYMNLTRLRSKYPIYDCLGANQALLAMTPEWATHFST